MSDQPWESVDIEINERNAALEKLREQLAQAERERDEISKSYYDCVALGTKYCNERDALRDQVETLREAAQRVESRIVAADSDTCQCESCVWLRKLRALAAMEPHCTCGMGDASMPDLHAKDCAIRTRKEQGKW